MMEITRQVLQERQFALIRHYLDRLTTLRELHGRGQSSAREALLSLDQEWQQLQAQQQWAAGMALSHREAASLVTAFADNAGDLLMQVEVKAALRWVEDALQWSDLNDLKQRHRLVIRGHDLYSLIMDLDRVRELLDEASVIVETLDDAVMRTDLARFNIDYYLANGEYDKQLQWAEHTLELAMRLEDPVQIAKAYHKLGFACMWNDQYSRADGYLKSGLELFKQTGMIPNTANIYNVLAANSYYWGKFEDVIPYGEKALAIAREYGRRDTELTVFTNMGVFLSGSGDLEKGLHYGIQGLAAAVEAGSLKSEFTALGTILLAAARLGLAHEVSVYTQRALERKNQLPKGDQLMATVDWVQWYIAHERGDWQAARQHGEYMAEKAQKLGNDQGEHAARGCLAITLIEMGELNAAEAEHLRALEIRDETYENPVERASDLIGLSRIEAIRGNHEAARARFNQFFGLMTETNLQELSPPFMVAWNAYHAATLLGDSRAEVILDHFDALLDQYLVYIQDERLRTSFLNQYSLRSLMALRPRVPLTPNPSPTQAGKGE